MKLKLDKVLLIEIRILLYLDILNSLFLVVCSIYIIIIISVQNNCKTDSADAYLEVQQTTVEESKIIIILCKSLKGIYLLLSYKVVSRMPGYAS